jgi:hypothetical protein
MTKAQLQAPFWEDLSRLKVQPFGCEFTFIPRDVRKEKDLYGEIVKLELKTPVRFHSDCGAVEHSTHIFTSVEEALFYYKNLRLFMAQHDFYPQIGQRPTGGLHIHVDFPVKSRAARASHVVKLVRFYGGRREAVQYMNEPGDYTNARWFSPDFVSCILGRSDKDIEESMRTQLSKKTNVFSVYKNRIEFRHFNAPRNEEELLLYIHHAQCMMQKEDPYNPHLPPASAWVCDRYGITTKPRDDVWRRILKTQIKQHDIENAKHVDLLPFTVAGCDDV